MAKKIKKKFLSFPVIYEAAEEGGYVASVPILPGCHTQGDTLEDAEKNIKEAVLLYLESMVMHKENVPQQRRILQGRVEVQV
jgi:predicted RNase H-like HicB family nuclease